IKKTAGHAPKMSHVAHPVLALASRASTRQIAFGEHPTGWQIHYSRPSSPLILSDPPPAYHTTSAGTQEVKRVAEVHPSQVEGLLAPFELALWVTEFSQQWALDLLVRAPSPRRPWSSIMLTLEDREQGFYKPVLMEYSRHNPEQIGWWAKLKEIVPGDY